MAPPQLKHFSGLAVVVLTNNTSQVFTSNKKQAGLGFQFPALRHQALITLSAKVSGGSDLSLSFGTGTPPKSGDAPAGTVFGMDSENDGSGIQTPVLVANLTGLTVGTTYWVDLQLVATSGAATLLVSQVIIRQ